jgi:hypothetical protein
MKRSLLLVGICLAVACMVAPLAAQAQVEVRVRAAPPAVRVEAVPPAPSPGHYWIGGHWEWEHASWVWHGGHWVEARVGEAWVRPHWVRVGPEWVFHPGHWAPIRAPREYVEVATETAPPLARVEVVTAPPSAEHFWVPGYWRWDGRVHVWVAGHWDLPRAGQVWVPAHWVREGHRWFLRGGHWQPV